jgi:XTP/dITP diphosphohydrolase
VPVAGAPITGGGLCYPERVPQLLIATNNPGKVAELRVLFEGCGWDLVTPAELGLTLDVSEDGETYAENARRKALAGMRASGLVTLADDSGIEIEAMGGEPGVHSARFLGDDATYAERFTEIERRLSGLLRGRRGCRFVCVMAVADPRSGDVRFADGEVRGLVAHEPRGEGGFGYDPIFWVPQHTATMAELPEHEKNIISHRARAAAQARQVLRELRYAYRENDPSYLRH